MAKKTKRPKGRAVCVLDRSGSMYSVVNDSIGGFNSFLEGQKKLKGNISMSVVLFDDVYTLLHDNVPVKQVEPLTRETYVPRGSTALLDAIGRAIKDTEANVEENEKVIVAILTDGHENASVEYKKMDIVKMIDEKKKQGWQFIFLGADQYSIDEAVAYGITSSHIYANTIHSYNLVTREICSGFACMGVTEPSDLTTDSSL